MVSFVFLFSGTRTVWLAGNTATSNELQGGHLFHPAQTGRETSGHEKRSYVQY